MISWVAARCVAAPCLVPARGRLDRRGAWWSRLYSWRRLLPASGETGARRAQASAVTKRLIPARYPSGRDGANVAHCSGDASCTGYAVMKGAARARRRRIGDARCVSPSSPSTGRHTNRDRAKDGRRLDLRTRRENLGRAERRPDARDVRRPRLVRRPRNNVLDLDVGRSRRRIDNLIGNIIRDHRYQIVVD